MSYTYLICLHRMDSLIALHLLDYSQVRPLGKSHALAHHRGGARCAGQIRPGKTGRPQMESFIRMGFEWIWEIFGFV